MSTIIYILAFVGFCSLCFSLFTEIGALCIGFSESREDDYEGH